MVCPPPPPAPALVVLSAAGMRSSLLLLRIPTPFLPAATQKRQLGFLVFLYLFANNLPQLCMHAVIFSPLWLLCIWLLEETLQALQQRVPGARSQSLRSKTVVSCWTDRAGLNALLRPGCFHSAAIPGPEKALTLSTSPTPSSGPPPQLAHLLALKLAWWYDPGHHSSEYSHCCPDSSQAELDTHLFTLTTGQGSTRGAQGGRWGPHSSSPTAASQQTDLF